MLKFYDVVFVGRPYFKMLTLFIFHVIGASIWEALHKGI